MSKKLLSEAQVRRFQTLATIKPLSEVNYNEEETMEEVAYKKDDHNESLYEEEEMEADADMEMDADDQMDEADVELDEELVARFAEAAATIQEVSEILSGGADEEDLGDEEPADDMDMGGDEPPAPEAEASPEGEEGEEDLDLQEALSGISYVPSQKEIVSTVAKRVAKRLQEAKRAQAKLNKALGKRR